MFYKVLALWLSISFLPLECSCAQAAHRLDPATENLKLLESAALRCTLSGQFGQSLPLYERAIDLAKKQYGARSPVVASMYFNTGMIALEASAYQKAEYFLSQAVQLNPSAVTPRVKLAEILRFRGRPDEARRQAQEALSKHRYSPQAMEELALCYVDLGDLSRANDEFARLTQVISGNLPGHESFAKQTVVPLHMPGAAATSGSPPAAQTQTEANVSASSGNATQNMLQKLYQRMKLEQERARKNMKSRKSASSKHTVTATPSEKKVASRPKSVSREKSRRGSKRGGGLVPPPPGVVPTYPGVYPSGEDSGARAKANAKMRKKERPKNQGGGKNTGGAEQTAVHEEKASSRAPTSSQDSDFLLDWASVKKKESK